MRLGGLDIGTTGCKLSVYEESGDYLCHAYREYDVSRRGGEHEIAVDVIFEAVCEVIREIPKDKQPHAIGVTTFGESFVALDEQDHPLLPAMLYTDPRGEEECRALAERFGEERLIAITGVKPHSMYSLPKLLWIKEKRPELFARIRRVMLMEDYIVYRLSGVRAIDYSLAARSMAFDIRQKTWSLPILEAAGVDPAWLSTPVPSGTVAGEMTAELAERLGMESGVQIVCGAHDQVASAVGAGVFDVGEAVDGTGTVECVVPVFDRVPTSRTLYDEGYSVVPYVEDGTYVCYALSFTGGAVLKWFRDQLAGKFEGVSNLYAELDRRAPDAPTGILVLPHFAGAANPYMDTGSKAAIIGLTLEHTAEDLYRALMEGVTYEIMTNLSHLQSFGIGLNRLTATGGGARSDVWMQIKADILNRPVTSLAAGEVGACGTCMLVGRAVGVFADLAEAKERFVVERKTYLPRPDAAERYQGLYAAYQRVYDAVRPIVEELKR